ncbi:XRE family transcriptional regulator [Alicyclobacillaceae bacterium I2511]|nr:XRE family transcriptional regulator [Alicyclobacillaceae bacterium I2511]
MPRFSERLVVLRKSHSMTQKQLGEAIGAHERGIRFYEAGTKQPTLDSLVKLANYFNVSLDYLVGRSDDPSWH